MWSIEVDWDETGLIEMRSKIFLGWIKICVMAAILVLVAIAPAVADRNRFIWIGTGGPAGTYQAVGSVLCDFVNKNSERHRQQGADITIRCSAPPSGGSSFNIRQTAIGAFTFGLSQSDGQYKAYHESDPEQVVPFAGLRSVFALYPEAFQIVVAKGSGIRSFRDLKGKRVNIGNPGSGTRETMHALMDAHGMTYGDLAEATQMTSSEYGAALCEGRIDAFVAATGFPARHVAAATDTCGARILDLDSEVEKNLVSKWPYYAFATIPRGTYASITEDVTTFGVVATLITSERVGDDVVYDVVRAVMEGLDDLRSRHPVLFDLDPKEMIKNGLTAPLHPGAIRYYEERGWL